MDDPQRRRGSPESGDQSWTLRAGAEQQPRVCRIPGRVRDRFNFSCARQLCRREAARGQGRSSIAFLALRAGRTNAGNFRRKLPRPVLTWPIGAFPWVMRLPAATYLPPPRSQSCKRLRLPRKNLCRLTQFCSRLLFATLDRNRSEMQSDEVFVSRGADQNGVPK